MQLQLFPAVLAKLLMKCPNHKLASRIFLRRNRTRSRHSSGSQSCCAGEDIIEHEEDDDDDSGFGNGSGYGNGYSGGQYDEYEKTVPEQYPYGYGLEALDLCESGFGYWACLAKMEKKQRENCCEGVYSDDIEGDYCCYRENVWKGTADYLFGSPNPHGGGGSSYVGGLVYAYHRGHYPTRAQHRQDQIMAIHHGGEN